MSTLAVHQSLDWRGTARYELVSRLGSGGMGVVYEVLDRDEQRTVALKTLLHFNPEALYLFKQEFRTLADVRHTNLVRLHELVVGEEGAAFFTMELVRGVEFTRYVRADVARLRSALGQLASGVQALHEAGKLHRDIKPSNVLVTGEGRVVLLDFGVATELKITHDGRSGNPGSGEIVGSIHYMAPEQADEAAPTPASDWYSVGVILYEALVGSPPFTGSVIEVLTAKNLRDAGAPSSLVEGVPDDLDALCLALLDRDPSRRPTGPEILRRLADPWSGPSFPKALPEHVTNLVGREAQLAALRAAFEVTRTGRQVTMRIAGASGMGKSTVVHHALDEFARADDALVLRGRAYARESVPYKAVDAIVDALSKHLVHRADADDPVPLPPDVEALARLFPVVRLVPGVDAAKGASFDDPQIVRRRAFVALRGLLGTLARERPLVLFVDDAQWGDVDSVALLMEVLRPPEAPRMLFVMTYRDDEAQGSAFLKEMRDRWPVGAEMRDVLVGPLAAEDARRLALSLLGESGDAAMRSAAAVAREAGGSPFLIGELVRGQRGMVGPGDRSDLGIISLERLVGERLDGLPAEARRLIELVAVGGRPLPVSVVARASGLDGAVDEAIALVTVRRFAHTGLHGGREVVTTIHDRIRETIVAQLPGEVLRRHHESLACALEEAPAVDAEGIAAHWLGAGDRARAAQFGETAAEHACGTLAFEQAIRLFQFTLENLPESSPREVERRVRLRLAQVLELAGRATESARAYLDLIDGASPSDQVEHRRAAADQLLAAGRIDEGTEILRGVLATVGMGAPRSPAVALFWLLVYRLWVAILGLGRVRGHAAADVSREDRLRVDALYTVSAGFAAVDIILGACMQARHFIEAVRRGDRFQVVRAVSLEVLRLHIAGKPVTPRETALVALGRRLAESEGNADALAFYEVVLGFGDYMRGRWREAHAAFLAPSGAHLRGSNRVQQQLFLARTYLFLGDPNECTAREQRLTAEAEDRGDLYTTVNIRTSTSIRKWIAADEPERARRDVDEAIAEWPQGRFLLQHWQAMTYGADIDLYFGERARAYDLFMRDMPRLKKSLLLHAAIVRAFTFYTQGRLAIASIAERPALRRARIAEARRMVRLLRAEWNPWTRVLEAIVEACANNADGDRPAAIASLRRALTHAESTSTLTHVPAVRYRLGQLLGGDEGREIERDARRTILEWGVRAPERWIAVYLPGTWES